MKRVEFLLKDILKPVLKNYSPVMLILKRNWINIIGEKYYEFCESEKVFFNRDKKNDGILYITCYNNIISFYIENNKPFITEKINSIFGYRLIKDLRLIQRPKIINTSLKMFSNKQLDEKDKKFIKDTLNCVEDNILKDSLNNLGKSIYLKAK